MRPLSQLQPSRSPPGSVRGGGCSLARCSKRISGVSGKHTKYGVSVPSTVSKPLAHAGARAYALRACSGAGRRLVARRAGSSSWGGVGYQAEPSFRLVAGLFDIERALVVFVPLVERPGVRCVLQIGVLVPVQAIQAHTGE